jgi:hypothetical protein
LVEIILQWVTSQDKNAPRLYTPTKGGSACNFGKRLSLSIKAIFGNCGATSPNAIVSASPHHIINVCL